MPSLGKHDELSVTRVHKGQIDEARAKYECHVETSKGVIQFGTDCQRRMNAVLLTLTPGKGDTVEWKMADNSYVTLTFEELRDLINEAQNLAGPKLLSAFQYAQTLKGKLEAGGFVSERDIAPEKWL
ncbi:hypothetical protein CNR34_00035 [Pseudomonas phage nickie]|uniref:DUF4376 domain-containing protein n=1 Tax=Pseudomonas phage nickie TaxID=2048977 RepID=A0A2H4P722_9CAUD|nr:hypothetical protein FDJ16_gp130 [Pseudomonas phage nickie]ATW57968.1 hypothetical protein CNR34_00035 [Pseudomonas phage nickie]